MDETITELRAEIAGLKLALGMIFVMVQKLVREEREPDLDVFTAPSIILGN